MKNVLDQNLDDYLWRIRHQSAIDQAISDWYRKANQKEATITAIGYVNWRIGPELARWQRTVMHGTHTSMTLRDILEHTYPIEKAPPPPSTPDPQPPSKNAIDLSKVKWLHHNISSWRQTSTINRVLIRPKTICIYHSMAGKWPVYQVLVKDKAIKGEGNPWVFASIKGQWYAATYEWLRPGQVCKGSPPDWMTKLSIGPHIKKSPLAEWIPRSGELVGFCVSTPARNDLRTSNERSNIAMVNWP